MSAEAAFLWQEHGWLATNNRLVSKVNRLVASEISRFYREKAQLSSVSEPLPGAITFVQRAGSALNANLHLHILALEGVYAPSNTDGSAACFHTGVSPEDDDIAKIVEKISRRTDKMLRRLGYFDTDAEFVTRPDADDMFQNNPAMMAALGASVQSKIAFGPRAGLFVRKIGRGFGFEDEVPVIKGYKCASINGFNLQAATYVGPAIARSTRKSRRLHGAFAACSRAAERYRQGRSRLHPKKQYSDGTRAVLFLPTEILEKLCAMVPPPRAHQVLYTGVFSSHSKWRSF